MNVLLDTNAFLWFSTNHRKSTEEGRKETQKADRVFYSIVSLWEIGLKKSGKGFDEIELPENWDFHLPSQVSRFGIELLSIDSNDCKTIEILLFHHKNPFDRMIIAETLRVDALMLSSDKTFDLYDGITRIW